MKILILSSSAGNGHNSAGNRLKEKFIKEQPDSVIEMVDIYKEYASKLKAWIMEDGYMFACNHLLGAYNYFFRKSEQVDYALKDTSSSHKRSYSVIYGIYKKILDFKPDLVISTYVFASVALRNIVRAYDIPCKVACMTLDYGVSPCWECTSEAIDYMFLTDEYMIEPFIKRGFKREQLIVSGIPISQDFYVERDKIESRIELGLDENIFTLVVMKASFFPINEKKLMKELSKVSKPIQVVIINGKSEKSKQKLDKLIAKMNLPHKIVNLGFTKDIPKIFSSADLILGKAGGLTTTETITCALPALILDKLPVQEIYNKDYMVERNCAIEVNKNTVSEKINYLINNQTAYSDMVESTKKVRKMNVVDTFYDKLKDIPTPDYSNVFLPNTPKEMIKNIEKARKYAVKLAKMMKKLDK